jgi:hypothetical protein
MSDMRGYLSSQLVKNELPVVGLCKDGHAVFGPTWPGSGDEVGGCFIDSCNGFFFKNPDLASEQQWLYGYATTFFHPYGPACFGPANYGGTNQEMQLCTTNGRICSRAT